MQPKPRPSKIQLWVVGARVAGLAVDRTRCKGEHAPPKLVNGRRCSDWVRSGPPRRPQLLYSVCALVSHKSCCSLHVLMPNPPAGEDEEPFTTPALVSEDSGARINIHQQTVNGCNCDSSSWHQACCFLFSYVKLGKIALICLRLCDARSSSAQTLIKRNNSHILLAAEATENLDITGIGLVRELFAL